MLKYELGKGIDLDFGATQPSVVHDMNPGDRGQPFEKPLPQAFNAGATALVALSVVGWTQAEQDGVAMQLEGSDNPFSGFQPVLDEDGNTVEVGGSTRSPQAIYRITIPPYLRLRNVSATAGDGYGSAYLLTN